MRGDEAGGSGVGGRAQRPGDRERGRGVLVAGRLVREQHAGVERERAGEGGALLLADRRLVREAWAELRRARASPSARPPRAAPRRAARPDAPGTRCSRARTARRAGRSAAARRRARPSPCPGSSTVPASGFSQPASRFSTVVLPEPELPTSAASSPSRTDDRDAVHGHDRLVAAVERLARRRAARRRPGPGRRRAAAARRASARCWKPRTRPCSSSSVACAAAVTVRSCVAMITVTPRSRERADRRQERGGRVRVELGGRLVGEHDPGARDERLRERGALLLAAGELGRHGGRAARSGRARRSASASSSRSPSPTRRRCSATGEVREEVVRRPLEDVGDRRRGAARRSAFDGSSARRRAPTSTVPAVGRSSPASSRSSVDFPLPETPTTAFSVPASNSASTPRSAGTSPASVR